MPYRFWGQIHIVSFDIGLIAAIGFERPLIIFLGYQLSSLFDAEVASQWIVMVPAN